MEEEDQIVAAATSEILGAAQGAVDSGSAEAGAAASSIPSFDSASANPDANVYSQNPGSVPQAAHGADGVVAPYDGAQGADASVYPTEHTSLNGTADQTADCPSAGATENGGATNEMSEPAPQQSYEDAVLSAEEARLWSVVTENCLDFNAWTALIDETEKNAESNILKIRKVYDAFLAEFPLCFGYWKKYADHEGRLDSVNKVIEVYERAVLAVTYSVDIWYNYCQFAISTYEDPDIIRRLFEQGLAYVGTDYRSNSLWDEYIKYEESLQAWSHLAVIYTRILEHPIQQLDRYFNCFKELTATRNLSDILTVEEASVYGVTAENSDQALDGEAHPDDAEKSAQPEISCSTEAENLAKYVSIREEMYKKAKEYESKIISFELAIRRPYFHVKPLDNPELENWHNYLDFIEREEDINKVIKLYERCVIACASYSEFWIRYVQCMEVRGSLELASNALARATHVFVKKQAEIHLFSARFKELNGDASGARVEYQHLYSELCPGLLEAIVKHSNMEHRLGDKESACLVYEKAIVAERQKEQSHILPTLLVQYSRFLYLVIHDLEKAREILTELHGQSNITKPILEAVIFLESIFPSEKRIEFLDSLVEKFLAPEPTQAELASASDKEEISSIFLEFLDLFGDAQSIKKATTRHTNLFSRKRSILPSKKRRADDGIMSDRDKLVKTGDVTQPVMGTDPNAHNPPVWPATSEASGHQWGAAYAPQAAYPAYGTYDYSHQMPQSAPQAAAYGAYPPTYSAQEIAPVLTDGRQQILLDMAEIDTRPLESVQAALTLFGQKSDQNRFSPDRNEQEIDILTKELASCKLQLEVKENENKQSNLKLEALQKAMQELSDKYDRACLDAHNRIAEIETDNSMITRQQSETADECMALKDELAIVKGELDTVKGSNAFVLKEVELMETRMILEREHTKGALMRILQLNEAVLSSAVAAIRAEEERSVFFQEITLEFFNSDKKLEVIKRQVEMIESLENELLAKTVEIDYFQSELKQVKELYISPQEVSDVTADDAAGCTNINDQVCETTVEDQKPQAEVAFQHSTETCFVTETSRKDCQVVTSDDTDMEGKMSEDVIEDTEGAEVMVLDSTMLVKNFDAQEACFVNKISQEDDKIIDSNEAENKAGDQEPEAEATVPNSTACKCVSEHADVCLASEIPREAYEVTRSDDKDEAENHEPRGELTVADNTTCHGNPEAADTYFDAEQPGKDHQNTQPDDRNTTSTMPENVLEVHEEPKAKGCFVAESSVEDFQSVHSGDKDMDITMPENVAGNQEPQAEDTAPNSTPCKGNSEAAGNCFVTEIVTEISKDDDDEAFYTKEIGQANKLDEGYVLVTKKTDDSGALKDKLDAAHTEISDLRFSLEEAVRRAELAEEAKAALERELREEIQRKQRPRRRAPLEDVRRAREATPATPPARLRPTPSWTPGMPRSAARGDERPWPGCLTLGKVLNMKYK